MGDRSSTAPSDTSHPAASFRPHPDRRDRVFKARQAEPDITKALIFLDANVLLAPYRTSGAALEAIREAYTRLARDARLVVPGQAAAEFARNRHSLVAGLYKAIRDGRSLSINGKYELPPIVRGLAEFEAARAAFGAMQDALQLFRRAMDDMSRSVAQWQFDDPILQVYQTIFDTSVVKELSLSLETLETIRRERYAARVPPGWRDKDKPDGGGGDLAMWLTILEVASAQGRDAILVTEERKDDWFHLAGDEPLFPRYELVEEFRSATEGHSFGAITLSALLSRLNVRADVVEQVRQSELFERRVGRLGVSAGRLPATAHTAVSLVERGIARVKGDALDAPARDYGVDYIFSAQDQKFGVEVLVFRGGEQMFEKVDVAMRRAIDTKARFGLDELVIVVVTRDDNEAPAAAERYGQSPSENGVSVVIAHYGAGVAVILSNSSSHPIMRLAFPVGGHSGA